MVDNKKRGGCIKDQYEVKISKETAKGPWPIKKKRKKKKRKPKTISETG